MPTRAGVQRAWSESAECVSVKMKLPSHGVGEEGVPMDLDVEAVFLICTSAEFFIDRETGKRNNSCQKAQTTAANDDSRPGCPEIACDSAVVETAHLDCQENRFEFWR